MNLVAVPVDEPWFRVHFRKKMIVVQGVAELERLKARKVPKVILVEPAQVHECSICHKREAWGPNWCWYGSWKAIEEGRPVRKFCSSDCRKRWRGEAPKRKGFQLGFWRPEEDRSETWRAIHEAKAAANPRRFPWPEWPKEGRGWCRWCGGEIINRSGRRVGKRSHVREWHRCSYGDPRDCRLEADLHVNLDVQYWHLVERDGIGCAICGKGDGKWVKGSYSWFDEEREIGCSWLRWSVELEVDHIIPLWAVVGLPDEIRRAYFGVVNLWLLCKQHHRWKSGLEAGERAAGGIADASVQKRLERLIASATPLG